MASAGETMGSRGPATAAATGGWPAQAADFVEQAVGTVRDRAIEPVEKVARLVVYGLLAGVLGVVALVLVAVGAVRALDELLPSEVWLAHAVVGGIFTLAGVFLWSKRSARPRE